MARWILRVALAMMALALLAAAFRVDHVWMSRHVAVPGRYLGTPDWWLPALRVASVLLAVSLAAIALRLRPSSGRALFAPAGRIALALCAAAVATEIVLRAIERPEVETPNPRLEWQLGREDAALGWVLLPGRTTTITSRPTGRRVNYAVNAWGDRAASEDAVEDPRAPTILLTGESIAFGHGLEYPDTIAAQLARRMGVQVITVAVGGYGSDQAHLRAVEALGRFERPIAVVTTFLPVQLFRNLQDYRPRLALRDGRLVATPPAASTLRVRDLLVNRIPYFSESRIAEAIEVTRAVLKATSIEAEARGAQALFVVPSFGPPRALDDHDEAWAIRGALVGLPHVVVDLPHERLLPWDGHPNRDGAGQIAAAIAEALASKKAAR